GAVGELGPLQGAVRFVDVGLMVLVVVDAHRRLVDVGLERVVGVGKIGNRKCHLAVSSGYRESDWKFRGSLTAAGLWPLAYGSPADLPSTPARRGLAAATVCEALHGLRRGSRATAGKAPPGVDFDGSEEEDRRVRTGPEPRGGAAACRRTRAVETLRPR